MPWGADLPYERAFSLMLDGGMGVYAPLEEAGAPAAQGQLAFLAWGEGRLPSVAYRTTHGVRLTVDPQTLRLEGDHWDELELHLPIKASGVSGVVRHGWGVGIDGGGAGSATLTLRAGLGSNLGRPELWYMAEVGLAVDFGLPAALAGAPEPFLIPEVRVTLRLWDVEVWSAIGARGGALTAPVPELVSGVSVRGTLLTCRSHQP